MSIEEQIGSVKKHISNLNDETETEVDTELFDSLIARITIDKSIGLVLDQEFVSLLIQTLYNTELNIELDKIIELLEALLQNADFQEIIALFPFEHLVQAIKSSNQDLQILALDLCSRADPPDMVSNTDIIPISVELLANKNTSIKVVNAIEKSFKKLVSGQLIRRRILSEQVLSTFRSIKISGDSVTKSRLLDVLVSIIPFLQEFEDIDELLQFDDFFGDDILYTMSLIKFYTNFVKISDKSNKRWLLKKIDRQIITIGELFKRREEFIEVLYYALDTLGAFFTRLSYTAPDKLKALDITFTVEDMRVFQGLSVEYLYENYLELLKGLKFNHWNIAIFVNMMDKRETFEMVKSKLVLQELFKMPYLHFVAIVYGFLKTSWGRKSLLSEFPQFMNKILEGDKVTETVAVTYRKKVLEKLNALSDEDLKIWRNGVRSEYSKLVNGRTFNPQVSLLSKTL